jgi:DNA-binding response OmpR family regulator
MPTILIAEDDQHLRVLLKQILELNNYCVIAVSDGQQAINYIKENPVDLLITDLIMPKKEGIETISELKKTYHDLPIFAMSGGSLTSTDIYLKIAKNLGVTKTFLKPFNVTEMLEAIKSVV